jgi:hypothetical protein
MPALPKRTLFVIKQKISLHDLIIKAYTDNLGITIERAEEKLANIFDTAKNLVIQNITGDILGVDTIFGDDPNFSPTQNFQIYSQEFLINASGLFQSIDYRVTFEKITSLKDIYVSSEMDIANETTISILIC